MKIIITLAFLHTLFLVPVSALGSSELSKGWPKIKSYKESECLVMEENKIAVESSAWSKEFSILTKFLLHNAEGEVYVNPKVKKGFSSITFSFEKAKVASAKDSAIFNGCYKRIELEIGANVENYKKLFIVLDDVVLYDFPLY